jgi:hypothetical protein
MHNNAYWFLRAKAEPESFIIFREMLPSFQTEI